jgi:hypothetical protein
VSETGVNASLLGAALDLSLVQLLRSAIRTADVSSAAGHSTVNRSPSQAAIRTVARATGSRNSDHAAATYEPRAGHYWHPRLNQLQPCTCDRPVTPADTQPTIQPPWKVLPWPMSDKTKCVQAHRTIKVQPIVADVSCVGRTLDLFV